MPKFSSIQKLNQRHYKILDYYIQGLPNKEIAKLVKMTEPSVAVITRAPSFQHEASIRRKAFEEDLDEKLATKQSEASEILQKNAANAAKTLVEVMIDPTTNKPTRLRSAEAILDRTGLSKQTRQDIDNSTIINLKREDLELLNETLALEKQILDSTKPKTVICKVQDTESEDTL